MSNQTLEYSSQQVAYFERLKTVLISVAFAFIIGAYTVILELKNSVFVHTVGLKSIPTARILSMFVLIPFIFIYSRLVDQLRRYYLVSFYCVFYGLMGLVFAYYFADPLIGIPNTDASPYRLFGWIFYFFVESYPPFVVSVFWAFVNSVSSPESAKKNYASIVAASKLGGMAAAGTAAWWLSRACAISAVSHDTYNHQLLLSFSSLTLLCVPFIVFLIMKHVPGKFLHGYEAVYKFEKKKEQQEHIGRRTPWQAIVHVWSSMTSGLTIFTKQPYVLGIFGMVFLYEVVYVVFSFLRIAESQRGASSLSAVTNSLFDQILIVHAIGFLLAIGATKPLLRRLGERYCLLLIPLMSSVFLIYLLVSYSPAAVSVGFIALRAINYAFSQPIRESLYIPTTKDLKFKSKSWIDAFGSKFAKSTGSTFNIVASSAGAVWFMSLYATFFACILSFWFITAYWLGKRFERAVAHNEVIGGE
jgi:ATP:ADP antiporter, AAA family